MMILGKDLIGNPVISVRDGQILGRVKDLYLDQELSTLTGIYLGGSGLFNRQYHYVTRDSITTLGQDAVLILAADAIVESQSAAGDDDWLRRDDIQGRGVDTPGGTKIGAVDDVILTPQGHVMGFSLGRVLVDGPIAEKQAIARRAVTEPGTGDGPMLIDLRKAEAQQLAVVVPDLFSGEKKATRQMETPDQPSTPDSEEAQEAFDKELINE